MAAMKRGLGEKPASRHPELRQIARHPFLLPGFWQSSAQVPAVVPCCQAASPRATSKARDRVWATTLQAGPAPGSCCCHWKGPAAEAARPRLSLTAGPLAPRFLLGPRRARAVWVSASQPVKGCCGRAAGLSVTGLPHTQPSGGVQKTVNEHLLEESGSVDEEVTIGGRR